MDGNRNHRRGDNGLSKRSAILPHVAVPQQNCKFITADPGCDGITTGGIFQPLPQDRQKLVSTAMTKSIVDQLEPIDIDQ